MCKFVSCQPTFKGTFILALVASIRLLASVRKLVPNEAEFQITFVFTLITRKRLVITVRKFVYFYFCFRVVRNSH